MAQVCCPVCNHIFISEETFPVCQNCGWRGTWKPEPEPERSREIVYSSEVWRHV